MEEYTKEFFWDVYKTLPEDLKEAIFSEKNNQIIYNTCSGLGLDEDQTAIVAKYTGRVLMGLLPLKEFSVTLELELNIPEGLAEKIDYEITLGIFKHLRVSLTKLDEQKGVHSHHIPKFYEDNFSEEKENKKTESQTKKELEPKKITEPEKKEPIIFPEIETLEALLAKNMPTANIFLEKDSLSFVKSSSQKELKKSSDPANLNRGESLEKSNSSNTQTEPEPPMPTPPNPIEKALSEINKSIEKTPIKEITKPASSATPNSEYKDPYRELPL